MTNFIIACIALTFTVLYWDDPVHQFIVGANLVTFMWCAIDLVKDLTGS